MAPMRAGVGLARSFPPPHLSGAPPGRSDGPAPAMYDDAWKPWGNHAGGMTRGTATTSAATVSDVFPSSGNRARRDSDDEPCHHSTDGWRCREPAAAAQYQHQCPPTAVAGRCIHRAPSPTCSPQLQPPPPPPPPPPQPPLSAASLRASLRRRETPPTPSPAAGDGAGASAVPGPSIRPPPRTRSPDRFDNRSWRQETRRSRPQPRRAPSEDGGNPRDGSAGSDEDRSTGRGSESGSEWWAGGGGGSDAPRGLDEGPGSDYRESSGVQENTHRTGKPLHVVSL